MKNKSGKGPRKPIPPEKTEKPGNFTDQVYERVIHYFREISKIPRGSGNEKAIADWLVEGFAVKHGLEYKRSPGDEVIRGKKTHNVVISKAATAGYENFAPVILQGHIDMVCQKTADSTHNFEKDEIIIITEDNIMTADRTTLGADDGIGVACALAILEGGDGINHPPIQALFTSDEEAGMTGASAVTADLLGGVKDKRLINIDTEEEGIFYNACAGGVDANFDLPAAFESIPENYVLVQIELNGLKGGHSGVEIHKGHANANKLMARTLSAIEEALLIKNDKDGSPIYLAAYTGGDKRNAITKEVTATIAVPKEKAEDVIELTDSCFRIFREEYKGIEDDMMLSAKFVASDFARIMVASQESTGKLIELILRIPNGIIAWLDKDKNLVETSCNLGIVQMKSGGVFLSSMIRSFYRPKLLEVTTEMRKLASGLGVNFLAEGESPAWAPANESELVNRFIAAYKSAFDGKIPRIESIHAGLECGYFAKKFPDMDIIACGPTITGAHTTEETLYLESTKKVVELLLTVLNQMNETPKVCDETIGAAKKTGERSHFCACLI